MKAEEVLKLLDAGYSREEIAELSEPAGEDPAAEPAGEDPAAEPAGEDPAENATEIDKIREEFAATIKGLQDELQALTKAAQDYNIIMSTQSGTPDKVQTPEDLLATIVAPEPLARKSEGKNR